MMSAHELVSELADLMFGGSEMAAGLAVFAIVALLLFACIRDTKVATIACIPVTFLFSGLGVLGTDVMVLMIIVEVLALAAVQYGGDASLGGRRR